MRSMAQSHPSLSTGQVHSMSPDSFFAVDDEKLVRLIHDEFPDELNRLTRAYSIRDQDFTPPSTPSPSYILYGKDYDEVNRTLVSVLALRWIYNGQYETFVETQPEHLRLKRESFNWIREIFAKGITSPADFHALITSIVVNDLGKDPQLAADYHDKMGEDISDLNHDMILLKAVKDGLVQSLDRLTPEHKANVILGMELGSEFNFGQLAQAENAPFCLSILAKMAGKERAFEQRFMEQLLDIAGASGHMDWTCAKKLIEPIFEAYHNVYDVANAVISSVLGWHDGYDLILIRRTEMLHAKGFRALDIDNPRERALMRLLCMGGVADLETAELYDTVWKDLDDSTKASLIHTLNLDGSVTEPAVQPTYMPALLAQGVDPTRPRSRFEKEASLRAILRYCSRVMRITDKPDGQVIVIERNALWVLQHVVLSPEFKADPSVLETTDVPKSVVAMTR
ncbi:hypothetical protein F5882DRAFT_371005 [Hyaloscypha sp. PMI_1271]|nr:hypothetical protein F5882DRAFT_371005 [Hyaloscypha sp. PMI_1271]